MNTIDEHYSDRDATTLSCEPQIVLEGDMRFGVPPPDATRMTRCNHTFV